MHDNQAIFFMGIDLGTGGARAVVCDHKGKVQALTDRPLINGTVLDLPSSYHEQQVDSWWEAVVMVIRQVLEELGRKNFHPKSIIAIGVTSTSGTILPMDKDNIPLYPAMMYNDNRAIVESDLINQCAQEFNRKHGRLFNPSYALAKILWMKRNRPEIWQKTRRWIHAADFIVGKLTDDFGVSDYSNALKTGYDLYDFRWPGFIENNLDISLKMFPTVIAPGDIIGKVSARCSEETGLSKDTRVCAGMTDSSASLLATGAAQPGDWSSTIGTTLSIKGITEKEIRDESGAVYCHRHPAGWWMPGAASNVGGEWLTKLFPNIDKNEMNEKAAQFGVSNVLVYPLVRKGERFPFVNPDAEGFIIGEAKDEVDLYRGYLEGTGFVEKLCYETLDQLGGFIGEELYIAGGTARSLAWAQIRADILQKRLLIPELPEACLGAAILAASRTYYQNLTDAGKNMARVDRILEPNRNMSSLYSQKYGMFLNYLVQRNYIHQKPPDTPVDS